MNFIVLHMLMSERVKNWGLVFAFAFSTFLLQNQISTRCGTIMRTGSQILDVIDADVRVMGPSSQYFEHTKSLKDIDLN